MKAKIRGTEIYFDIAGTQHVPTKKGTIKEHPVLFMLHGGPGSNHIRYKTHCIELQEVSQLVFIDHRGSGYSKKTKAADYTLENNIEDIEALRKHLGLEKISILGTSYGGIVAQGYAIRYPKNVEKLILVATAPSYRTLGEAQKILQERGTPKQIAMSKHLWDGTFKNPKHVQEFFTVMDPIYSYAAKMKKKSVFGNVALPYSHQALNKGFGGFLRHYDYIPQLKKITCPTLILAGELDWICNPEQSKTLAQHIPHSKLHIFKNCGHAIATDVHDKYIQIVKRFLKR